jgi:sulfite reductase (NADPH) hemoprotein beta-component
MESHFQPPDYQALSANLGTLSEQRLSDPEFGRWVAQNVAAHKQPGYAIVVLSTKVAGIPPGDVTDSQMDAVADWSERFGFGEIRISHEQNFVLPDVRIECLYELWQAAHEAELAEANIGLLGNIICCPGGDYCSLANAKSIPVAEAIQREIAEVDYQHDLGPIDLNISGCMNACGHHHVGNIGILGVDKKGEEFYQISLGGHSGHSGIEASLGKIVGPSCSRAEVTEVISKILDVFVEQRNDEEAFIHCIKRIGLDPFKERIYANAE